MDANLFIVKIFIPTFYLYPDIQQHCNHQQSKTNRKLWMKSLNQAKEFEILQVNRYEVEQNAVFLDYTVQTLLTEIQSFAETKIYIRQSMSKNLKTIEDVLSNQDKFSQFLTLLEKMSHDHEDIQVQLLKYLKEKASSGEYHKHYREQIEKPLIGLAKGPYLQIKQQSCSILSELTHKLAADQKKQIISFAKQLALADSQQDKIVSLQLLAKLGPDMDMQQRKKIYDELFMNIYAAASVRVRKQIILEIGRLSAYLDPEFVENKIVMQFFLKQTQQTAWGIRKACVQIMTSLLQNIKNHKNQLSNSLLDLLKDGNKFVRIAAFKVVPEFLAKYGSKQIPEKLFQIYLNMIDLDINNQVSKLNEIVIKVSFYFPGVLYTVGPYRWPKMQKLFNRLLHFKSQEVKMPLASSLHEIGAIIGPQKSKQYLFSALDFILKQPSDYLKLSAIQNLSKFVEQFQKVTRQNLIDVFLVLQKDPKKWRVRYSIASQLKYLSKLYDAQTTFKYIFPISLKLCNDNVSQVRYQAAKQIVNVLEHLKSDEHLYQMGVESIKGYALSEKFIQRQTFCIMLEYLYDNVDQFLLKYGQMVEPLTKDYIPLVRIALAISLRNVIDDKKCDHPDFRKFIANLKQDEEVQEYLSDIWAQKSSQMIKQ